MWWATPPTPSIEAATTNSVFLLTRWAGEESTLTLNSIYASPQKFVHKRTWNIITINIHRSHFMDGWEEILCTQIETGFRSPQDAEYLLSIPYDYEDNTLAQHSFCWCPETTLITRNTRTIYYRPFHHKQCVVGVKGHIAARGRINIGNGLM